jgi:hypothetical protein
MKKTPTDLQNNQSPKNRMNEWNWMEWIPTYSIPFHSFFTKPNNGISLYPTSFHSIPSLSTNPNIA